MIEYTAGGRPVTAVNLLLLISEMEGTYQHLKYMGFEEDCETINQMKQTYYKLYFKKRRKNQYPPYPPPDEPELLPPLLLPELDEDEEELLLLDEPLL